jgi:hypothetical protein
MSDRPGWSGWCHQRTSLRVGYAIRLSLPRSGKIERSLCSRSSGRAFPVCWNWRAYSCRDWDDEWEDSETGQTMKRFGVEVWTMRNGKIAIWAAAFNAAPAKQALTIEQTVSRWSARSDSQPILR